MEEIVRAVLIFLVSLLLPGFVSAAEKIRVVASIEPLSMIARDVMGDSAAVETLLRPAQNVHSASLTPGQARAIRDADLFVWLGGEAEPQLAPLVARRGGDTLAMLEQRGVTRLGGGHGHEGGRHDHDRMMLDPHLWLAPENARALAMALSETTGRDPASFLAALRAAQDRVRERLAPFRESPWLSHHDPWAYFYRSFPLTEPLTLSEGSPRGISSKQLLELARRMQADRVHCAIAEPEARRALLEKLCQDDCRIVEADPLGRDLAGTGYTAFLETIGARFADCLRN
jgi:zinc transport system substrate-binding protein